MDFVVLNRDEEAEIMLTDNGYDKATVNSAKFHEEIDGLSTLDLEVPVTIDTAIYVREENIIGFFDESVSLGAWRFFVIKEVKIIDTVPQKSMTVHCEDYSQELIDTIYYREQKGKTNTVAFMVDEILSNTRWEVNPTKPLDNPTITTPFPEETQFKTSLEALQIVASVFGLHLEFEFQYFDMKIQHRYLTMKAELGEDRGVTFDYNVNISEIERTIDSTNVKTAIVPYGKETDGNFVNISNVVWTKPTNPANKPAGSAILEDTDATALWGFGDGTGNKRPRYVYYSNTDVTDPNVLIKEAWNQLQTVNTPKVNYKLTVLDLYALSGYDVDVLDMRVCLGDIINVVDRSFLYNMMVKTHVISRDVDLLNVGSTEIELGNFVGSIVQTTSSLSGLSSETNVMNITTGLARLENNVTVLGDGVIELKENIGDPSVPINYNWVRNSEVNNGTRYWTFTGTTEIALVTGIPYFTTGVKLTNNASVKQYIVGIEKFIGYDITLSVFAKSDTAENTGHFNIHINYIETDTGTAMTKEIQSPTFSPLTTDWQRFSFTTPIVKEADMQSITSIDFEYVKDNVTGSTALTGFMMNLGSTPSKYIKNPDDRIGTGSYDMIKAVNNANFESGSSYVYIEEEDGIWVYDKPNNDPDNPPTKAVILKGGMLGIANWDSENNEWNVGAFINGQSVNADYINAGTLSADRLEIGGINQEKLAQDVQDILGSVEGKADASWVTQELTARDGEIALKATQTDLESVETLANTASTNASNAVSTANTAKTTADNAKSSADIANSKLSDIASDSKLTAVEKQATKKEWDIIVSEKTKNDTQADTFGITTEKTAYDNAYGTLNTYVTPLLSDLTVTSDITGNTFRTNFKNYYDARTVLLNAISTKAKSIADTASTSASSAVSTANAVNAKLTDISSDSKLTALEKQATQKEWDTIVAEKSSIDSQADTFGITTEKTNYDNSYGTLNTYITPLLTDLTTTSDITGTTFRNNFKNYYTARTALLNAIAAKAKTIADTASSAASSAQTTANLKRRVFTSQPTLPYDVGDLWVTSLAGTGDLYTCKTARSSGSYTASDWIKGVKYTDDTKANAVARDVSNLTTRVSTAEQKITPSAIVSTVRTSTEYTNDLGEKIDSTQATQIAQTAENVKIGFNNISDRVVIADTGLTINNNSSEPVLSADSNGNLVMKGKLTAGGADRIELDNGQLSFFKDGMIVHTIYPKDLPVKMFISNYKGSIGDTPIHNTRQSQGNWIYGRIATQWFHLYIASSLTVGDYAVFNNVSILDPSYKSISGIGAITAFSTAHEIFPAVVNWGLDSNGLYLTNVSFRLRNITQTTQPARYVDVCLAVFGSIIY